MMTHPQLKVRERENAIRALNFVQKHLLSVSESASSAFDLI